MKDNYFAELNSVNVNEHVEQKNRLSYLSWAWAWAEIKKRYPDSTYRIYESENGCFYHTDGRTCWVKTGVTVNGIEHIEYLPVMDYKNKSIPLEDITSFDVNKAIQRSLTKAVARHGLGLYIYAGEDLPEEEAQEKKNEVTAAKQKQIDGIVPDLTCPICGKEVKPAKNREGEVITAQEIFDKYGMCLNCVRNQNEPAS